MNGLPYAVGSPTSYAAAQRARGRAGDDRARIFALIHKAGIHGLTRQEIEDASARDGHQLPLRVDTIRPRVLELIERGLIEVSDELRRSPAGNPCAVLVSTTLARNLAGPAVRPPPATQATLINQQEVA